jgi:hypothetical protein
MQKFRQELHRFRWLLVIAIVVGLVFRWWSQRDQAERLTDIPNNYAWTMYKDQIYWLTAGRFSGITLRSMPMTGGTPHDYGEDPGSWREAQIVGFNEAGIFYITAEEQQGNFRSMPQPKQRFMPPSTQGHPPASAPSSGSAPPGPSSPPTAAQGRPSTQMPSSPAERPAPRPIQKLSFLHHIPLSGESAEEITRVFTVSQINAAVAGERIYWTCSHPISEQQGKQNAMVDRSEITSRPVQGGTAVQNLPTRAIYTAIYPGTDGVYCAQRPDPFTKHLQLVHIKPDGSAPQVLNDYDSWDPPVEWNGRVYWTKPYASEGIAQMGLHSNTLVSARPDGSDFRIHCKLPVNESLTVNQPGLVLHRDKLYLMMTERAPNTTGDEFQTVLFRIHLDRPNKLEQLCSLRRKGAGGGQFDGDYFYFSITENRAGWLEEVTDRVPNGKLAQVLFRYRLPD